MNGKEANNSNVHYAKSYVKGDDAEDASRVDKSI